MGTNARTCLRVHCGSGCVNPSRRDIFLQGSEGSWIFWLLCAERSCDGDHVCARARGDDLGWALKRVAVVAMTAKTTADVQSIARITDSKASYCAILGLLVATMGTLAVSVAVAGSSRSSSYTATEHPSHVSFACSPPKLGFEPITRATQYNRPRPPAKVGVFCSSPHIFD